MSDARNNPDPAELDYTEPAVPSEVGKLHDIISAESAGRTRNGRIALLLAVALVLAVVTAAVAIGGWKSTSSSLEARNTAVENLGHDLTLLNKRSILQGEVASCARDALAAAFDDALVRDNYEEGRLLQFYNRCQETDGRTFRGG